VGKAFGLYNWTGFYVGGHLGAGFRDGSDPFGNADYTHFVGGGQIGADYQFGSSWVIGI
jgi:outer membrane immunogenic protein